MIKIKNISQSTLSINGKRIGPSEEMEVEKEVGLAAVSSYGQGAIFLSEKIEPAPIEPEPIQAESPVAESEIITETPVQVPPIEVVAEEVIVEKKEFACDQCDKSFDNEKGIRMHKMVKHPPTVSIN